MRNACLLLATLTGGVAPRPLLAAQQPASSRRSAIVTAAARLAPAVVSVNVLRRGPAPPPEPLYPFFLPRGAGQGNRALRPRVLHSPPPLAAHHPPVTPRPP